MKTKKLTLGIFGFGCVGQGLWDVIHQTRGLKADIAKICVKDPGKKRSIAAENFTFNRDEILFDPTINVVVELINDAAEAYHIVKTALQNGKAVVSANKKMIAEHLEELIALQEEYNVPLLYEASCCASIPIIRNFEEYYDNDLLQSLEGIVNGSTNYILTRTSQHQLSYAQALKQAQEKGYAETDPSLDVEGLDARYKLTILLAHAFGILADPEQILNIGINRLGPLEFQIAREKGYKIKLVAQAQRVSDHEIACFVLPKFVSPESNLYRVDDVFNGVQLESSFADKQFFSGRGAGDHPTASAVLSDISALSYDYRYEYKKLQQDHYTLTDRVLLDVFIRYQNEEEISRSDFYSIDATYASVGNKYLSGKIFLDTLKISSWVNKPGVSLVLNSDSVLHKAESLLEAVEKAF